MLLFVAGKRCHFGKKQVQFGKKIFFEPKAFGKWALAMKKAWNNYRLPYPPLTSIKTRFGLQSITSQIVKYNYGVSGHRCFPDPIKGKKLPIWPQAQDTFRYLEEDFMTSTQHRF